MRKKAKEIIFFIDKCKFLKFKIFLSSLIKSATVLIGIVISLLLLLFFYNSLSAGYLDVQKIVYVGILYVFYTGLKFLDTYYSHYISYEVIENLRDDIFRHYYMIFPGAVEDIKTGDFIQMIVNDINVFEWFIAHILTEWIAFIFVSVIITYFVFIKSFVAGIALLSFIFLVVKLFLGTVIQKEEQGIKIKNLGGDLTAGVIDGLSGFKELVFYNRTVDFFNKIEMKSKKYNEVSEKYLCAEFKDNLLIDLLAIILLVVITPFIQIKGIKAIVYVLMITLYYFFLKNCIYQTGNFGFVFGALNRLKKVYDISPVIKKYGDGDIDVLDIDKGIEFVNCSFYYNKNPLNHVLNKVNFKADRGQKTVIVSSSGGGKSTIFKLINRYYELNGGEIKLFGKSLKDYTERTLRENITTFSQNNFFFNDSLINNLKYAKGNLDIKEIEVLAKKLNSYDFIAGKEKDFENVISESGDNYSGGELQRLSILRGFIKDSPILLMDEISSALDDKNEEILNNILDDIKENKIIIIAAHKLSTIQKADKIIFLKNGEISGEGKYDELLSNNHFFKELVRGYEMEK